MGSFRIVRGTLSLVTVGLALGACSAPGRCGGECCGDRGAAPVASISPSTTAPSPIVTTAQPATEIPNQGAPAAPVAVAHPADASASPADAAVAAVVHNYKRLSPRIARAAAPEGDAAFAALAAAGIRSIVTVDGATPDVEGAKRHGIRYVHIPFGYDGIPEATGLELAKTFAQLASAGPMLVHCHHGKHRGPAACEIARIVLDEISNDEAIADMTRAGTDPRYAGLYASIRAFHKPTSEVLAAVKADMPEIAPAGSRSAAMSAIDKSWDRMKAVRTAKWNVPADHEDLEPSHEAVILAEGLREFGRRPEIASESEAFHKLLADCEASAWDLSKALEKGKVDADRSEVVFNATQTLCASCHAQFRDNTHR